jgi:hypothetical protein
LAQAITFRAFGAFEGELATVVLLNDLGASALESQNRKPDPGFGFPSKKLEAESTRL